MFRNFNSTFNYGLIFTTALLVFFVAFLTASLINGAVPSDRVWLAALVLPLGAALWQLVGWIRARSDAPDAAPLLLSAFGWLIIAGALLVCHFTQPVVSVVAWLLGLLGLALLLASVLLWSRPPIAPPSSES